MKFRVQLERIPPTSEWSLAVSSLERAPGDFLHFKKTSLALPSYITATSLEHLAYASTQKFSSPHYSYALNHCWPYSVFLLCFLKCSLAVKWGDTIGSVLCAKRGIICSDYFKHDNVLSNLVDINIVFLTDAALSLSLSFAWPDSLIVSSSSQRNWWELLTLGFRNCLGYTSVILSTCLTSWYRKTHKPLQSSKQSCVHCAASFAGRTNSVSPLHLTQISDTSQDLPLRVSHFTLHTHSLLKGELSYSFKGLSDLFTFTLLGDESVFCLRVNLILRN